MKTINVARVRYNGEEQYEEIIGFDTIALNNPGWVSFTWLKDSPEVVIINASRVAEIICSEEEE